MKRIIIAGWVGCILIPAVCWAILRVDGLQQSYIRLIDINNTPFGVSRVGNKLQTSATPYLYDIAKGNIPGKYANRHFGENLDIGTSNETIWDYGGTYTYPTEAEVIYVMSSSSADTQDYRIYGLDGNYDELDATVTASGRTPVAVSGTWLRVFHMQNVGSVSNAGEVYLSNDSINVTNGVPDTSTDVRAMIKINNNRTLMALWTVPNGHTAYLTSWHGSESSTKGATLQFVFREFGQVFAVVRTMRVLDSFFQQMFILPVPIPAKTDIQIRGAAVISGSDVSSGWELWYEL